MSQLFALLLLFEHAAAHACAHAGALPAAHDLGQPHHHRGSAHDAERGAPGVCPHRTPSTCPCCPCQPPRAALLLLLLLLCLAVLGWPTPGPTRGPHVGLSRPSFLPWLAVPTNCRCLAGLPLLCCALQDPLNQRFVLLSESDAPLYPAPMTWLQLVTEMQSRVRVCADQRRRPHEVCVGLHSGLGLLRWLAGCSPAGWSNTSWAPSPACPMLPLPACHVCTNAGWERQAPRLLAHGRWWGDRRGCPLAQERTVVRPHSRPCPGGGGCLPAVLLT